jgi:hypothetical protein
MTNEANCEAQGGTDMAREKTYQSFEEMSKNLALFRLASRELEGVSASCEMFFSHVVHEERGKKMQRLFNQFAAIQEKADKLREKLDAELEPFSVIEVKEIY